MNKNATIVFHGREMYRLLVRNRGNRAVTREDYKNNEFFADSSIKKGESRVKKYVKSIQDNGWFNFTVYAYKNENGQYVLLDGNTRREALDVLVNNGTLKDYPEWDVVDMSVKINPKTGKIYTFEEARDFVEFQNIHAQKAHTATDIIEAHAGDGNELCQEISNIAREFSVGTSMASDLVTGIKGSSKEENVERIITMNLSHERANDARKIFSMLDNMGKNTSEDINFKNNWHCVDAFSNVYYFCKACGVENEFCSMMEAVSCVKRPNPFKGFFDDSKVSVFMDKILYLINGFFDNTNVRQISSNMMKIHSAFEKCGAMASIAKFHQNVALGRTGMSLELPSKFVA